MGLFLESPPLQCSLLPPPMPSLLATSVSLMQPGWLPSATVRLSFSMCLLVSACGLVSDAGSRATWSMACSPLSATAGGRVFRQGLGTRGLETSQDYPAWGALLEGSGAQLEVLQGHGGLWGHHSLLPITHSVLGVYHLAFSREQNQRLHFQALAHVTVEAW